MNKYFIYLQNNVCGPFDAATVLNMFERGEIGNLTLISCGKNTPWKKFSEYSEFQQSSTANTQVRVAAIPITQTPAVSTVKVISPGNNLQSANSIAAIKSSAVPATVKANPEPEQKQEVIFYCPECNQKFAGGPSWIGRDVICCRCNNIFTAQLPEETASAATDNSFSTDNGNSFSNVENNTDVPPSSYWENSTGSIICPHCWLHFDSEQLLYISSHPTLMGDPVLGPLAMKRFSPTQFNALGQALDSMSYVATDLACPRCRLKIPATIIDRRSLYFSIVGAQSSGKSYYLATLLNCLRQKMANDFACSLIDVDPELNMVLDGYEETLFRSKHSTDVAVLPKTQQTGDKFTSVVTLDNIQVYLPKPFVYELRYMSKEDSAKDCNIIFYDNAGEHFAPGTDNASNPGTRHLACSDGIVFIFDPLNDALMRSKCNPDEPQLQSDSNVKDQTQLLSEMIARIRRHRNLEVDQKCDVPLVIGLCKYDAWSDLLPHDLKNLHTLYPNEGKLSAQWDKATVMDVSFAVRELMLKYAPALVNTAEGFFDQVTYVPFSNFGCIASSNASGDVGVIPAQINPIWTQETFFALLAESDMIDIKPNTAGGVPLPVQIFEDFMIFRHPTDGHIVRLPWNYSDCSLTIDEQVYKLPVHPRAAEKRAQKQQASSFATDLWS